MPAIQIIRAHEQSLKHRLRRAGKRDVGFLLSLPFSLIHVGFSQLTAIYNTGSKVARMESLAWAQAELDDLDWWNIVGHSGKGIPPPSTGIACRTRVAYTDLACRPTCHPPKCRVSDVSSVVVAPSYWVPGELWSHAGGIHTWRAKRTGVGRRFHGPRGLLVENFLLDPLRSGWRRAAVWLCSLDAKCFAFDQPTWIK